MDELEEGIVHDPQGSREGSVGEKEVSEGEKQPTQYSRKTLDIVFFSTKSNPANVSQMSMQCLLQTKQCRCFFIIDRKPSTGTPYPRKEHEITVGNEHLRRLRFIMRH